MPFLYPTPRLTVANNWTADQRFNDNVLLTFGDPNGTDGDLYYGLQARHQNQHQRKRTDA